MANSGPYPIEESSGPKKNILSVEERRERRRISVRLRIQRNLLQRRSRPRRRKGRTRA